MTPSPPAWPAAPVGWPAPVPPPPPRQRPPWSLVHIPAFWLLGPVVVLAVLGSALAGVFISLDVPASASVTLLLGSLGGAAWLAALLRLGDPVERRPVWLVAAALLWGGSVAIAVGAAGGYFADVLLAKAVTPTFAVQWGAALEAPYAEEIGKGAGVVMVLLVARPFVTTVWSGALYGALVGLGFTLVEDAGYALTSADEALPDDAGAAASILLLRLFVPGLVAHPLFTAVTGAGIAYAWLRHDRPRRRRTVVLFGALLGGAVLHAVVNSPLAFAATQALVDLPYAAYWAGYLLVVYAVALPWMWWLSTVRRADARLLLERAAELAPDAVLPAEIPTLAGVRARRAHERRIRRALGADAARRARRLRRAQLGLAAALARPHRGYPPVGPYGATPPVRRLWQEALAARHALPDFAALDPVPAQAAGPDETSPAAPAPLPAAPAVLPAAPVVLPAAPAPVPPARRWSTAVASSAVLVVAAAGALFWPLSVPAVAGAVVLARRRPGNRLTSIAIAAAAFTAYCTLASLLTTALDAW